MHLYIYFYVPIYNLDNIFEVWYFLYINGDTALRVYENQSKVVENSMMQSKYLAIFSACQ